MLSQRCQFSVIPSAARFDVYGRIIPQKLSEDRKMKDRKIFAGASIPSLSISLT